jgi:hypothetical protein
MDIISLVYTVVQLKPTLAREEKQANPHQKVKKKKTHPLKQNPKAI